MKQSVATALLACLLIISGISANAQAQINVNPKKVTGTSSPSVQSFTITNPGNSGLTFTLKEIETSAGSNISPENPFSHQGDSPDDFIIYLTNMPAGVSWMEVSPASGTIPPGGNQVVTVAFTIPELTGILNACILITSNDPGSPKTAVPVSLYESGSRSPCPNFVDTDNENNALTGSPDGDFNEFLFNDDPEEPIEFNFFIDETSITTAQLSLRVWDIDYSSGERDAVYLNGHFVGYLSGNNNQWSTAIFYPDPSWFVLGPGGKNLIQIQIDVLNEGDPEWATELDWGQLIINNCGVTHASIRSAVLDNTCREPGQQICVDVEVDTDIPSPGQLIDLEILLKDESNITVGGCDQTYTIIGADDELVTCCMTVPVSANTGVTFNVIVLVYDHNSLLQEDIETLPFQVQTGCGTADLSISKTVTPGPYYYGDDVTFTITVTNNGPDPATDIVINDLLPTGYSLVSHAESAGTYVAPGWSIPSLANGASATLTLVAEILETGDYLNIAMLQSVDETDPNPVNNEASAVIVDPTNPPSVPLSNWALFIGLGLIVAFVAIRFARIL